MPRHLPKLNILVTQCGATLTAYSKEGGEHQDLSTFIISAKLNGFNTPQRERVFKAFTTIQQDKMPASVRDDEVSATFTLCADLEQQLDLLTTALGKEFEITTSFASPHIEGRASPRKTASYARPTHKFS